MEYVLLVNELTDFIKFKEYLNILGIKYYQFDLFDRIFFVTIDNPGVLFSLKSNKNVIKIVKAQSQRNINHNYLVEKTILIDKKTLDNNKKYETDIFSWKSNICYNPIQNQFGNWGLARITNANKEYSSLPYISTAEFFNTGIGVDIYISNTGCNHINEEFSNRVKPIFSIEKNLDITDKIGVGTNQASICAGALQGIAMNSTLKIAKITNNNIVKNKDLLMGLHEIFADHLIKITSNINSPSILLFDIGQSIIDLENDAIDIILYCLNELSNNGIICITGSGNNGEDFSLNTTIDYKSIVWVGGSTLFDTISDLSNYGDVDIFAPSEHICCWKDSSNIDIVSGTQIAAAFVAGIMALLLEGKNISKDIFSTLFFKNQIKSISNNFVLKLNTKQQSTVNSLLYYNLLNIDYSKIRLINNKEHIFTLGNSCDLFISGIDCRTRICMIQSQTGNCIIDLKNGSTTFQIEKSLKIKSSIRLGNNIQIYLESGNVITLVNPINWYFIYKDNIPIDYNKFITQINLLAPSSQNDQYQLLIKSINKFAEKRR